MKRILISILMLASFVTFAQEKNDAVKLKAQQVLQIYEVQGADSILNQSEQETVMSLYSDLHQIAVSEIEEEASNNKMDKDTYIENDISFSTFVKSLEQKIENIKDMDKADILILMFKSGIRVRIQQSVRFIPENYEKNLQRSMELIKNVAAELGLNF